MVFVICDVILFRVSLLHDYINSKHGKKFVSDQNSGMDFRCDGMQRCKTILATRAFPITSEPLPQFR